MKKHQSLVGAVGLLFVILALGGCSTSRFWNRDCRVGGARQVAPPSCCPQPAPQRCAPPRTATAPPLTPRGLTAPPATPPTNRRAGPASTEEMEVLAFVNVIRRQHNLRPLNFQPDLWVAARDHSLEQQRSGFMGHGSPDPARKRLSQRMSQAGYRGSVFAEVVAWGYPDTRAVVEGWMNSPDHRRILIDPELTEGGFSRAGKYWTGNFGAPRRFARAAPSRQPTSRPPSATIPRAQYTPRPVPQAAPQRRRRKPAPAPRYQQPRPSLPFRVGNG